MSTFDSEMIDDHEFLIKRELTVVREVIEPHMCVCLLIKGSIMSPEAIADLTAAGIAAGIPEPVLENLASTHDKCKHMIENPDQPFCDGCEEAGHPDLDNQAGIQHMKEIE